MKDLGGLMKQAQAKILELTAEGTAGGGMVTVTLRGSGELVKVVLDEELIQPGEGEVIADLIIAAHAVALSKLNSQREKALQEAAGPMAGMMGGLPGMKF